MISMTCRVCKSKARRTMSGFNNLVPIWWCDVCKDEAKPLTTQVHDEIAIYTNNVTKKIAESLDLPLKINLAKPKISNVSEFQIGDYFTGIDRSFHRSLYEYLGTEYDKNRKQFHKAKLMFFNGDKKYAASKMISKFKDKDMKSYRKATKQEIEEYFKKGHCK